MLLRRSEESQDRVLAIIGGALLLIAICAVLIAASNPFGGRSSDRQSLTIETPYVGQGVQTGTAVVMHGVKVGQVTSVDSLPGGGGLRLAADLERRPVAGLTNTMSIDFRPINFFGVTGINVIPGAGGQELRDGAELDLVPKGNSTLPQLLSQLGDVSTGALSPRLIDVVDRATRYTDGLNPLLETMLLVTTAVADVQRVTTAQLVANTSAASTGFPAFIDSAFETGSRFIDLNIPQEAGGTSPAAAGPRVSPPFGEGTKVLSLSDETEDQFKNINLAFLDEASQGLFRAFGKLESSHVDDLLPVMDSTKAITDIIPPLIRPEKFAQSMVELRSRFEKLYAGNSEQRGLQVRIVLDSLPGVEASLGVIGGPG